ncbi:ring-cleaving dioxygenase [Pseudonocardia sp. TRM90224]|uniref:ring-cleaving dioxygenase n=1 Tax=Pseudonocardia sp. TRM90224 TaxID=2812678 RepID=UPI001E56F8C4|nr:ring-cleaving dioxygenase [Pseudonocardia sp. TRM90224]
MSAPAPHGLHHVTAIATQPQRNIDFYTRALGLRLVKQTVNYDAPESFHLYYGDTEGAPSTLLTFFAWPGAEAGHAGSGLVTATALSVPPQSIGWWQRHLTGLGIAVDGPHARAGEEVLTFRDPDGFVLDLVAAPGDHRSGWDGMAGIPAEHAVRGLHSVTMSERMPEHTVRLLTELLGMRAHSEDRGRMRFVMGDGGAGALVDVVPDSRARGLQSGGSVHHVALRAPDDATQEVWRQEILAAGLPVTEIRDRTYFRSIYFHEPGGVLLEIATDGPGFTVDEPLMELGRSLKLPPWLEPNREQIQASLPILLNRV